MFLGDGYSVDVVESDVIPPELVELATAKRTELIESLADVSDTIADLYLSELPISPSDIVSAIREATIARKFSPVFMGSAIKNTGVQALLDGVVNYLPNPAEVPVEAIDNAAAPSSSSTSTSSTTPATNTVPLVPASQAPLVGLAFKLEEGRFGQLTYMRMYAGTLRKGAVITNVRTGKKIKVPRLVRMYSDEMEVRLSSFLIFLEKGV